MKMSTTHAKIIISLNTLILVFVSFTFVAFVKIAKEESTYVNNEKSSIRVTGFTNLNKWRMDADSIQCESRFVFSGGDLEEIKFLKFSTPIMSLKSTHADMDTIVYKMLSTFGVKEISFVQTRQMVLPKMKMVNIIGDLTIGSVTRKADIQLSYAINADHEISFKGLKKIALRDYNITRNNAFLRSIKFDDEVMIQIEMNLSNGTVNHSNKKNTVLAD